MHLFMLLLFVERKVTKMNLPLWAQLKKRVGGEGGDERLGPCFTGNRLLISETPSGVFGNKLL